jgi:hypothetical protein
MWEANKKSSVDGNRGGLESGSGSTEDSTSRGNGYGSREGSLYAGTGYTASDEDSQRLSRVSFHRTVSGPVEATPHRTASLPADDGAMEVPLSAELRSWSLPTGGGGLHSSTFQLNLSRF